MSALFWLWDRGGPRTWPIGLALLLLQSCSSGWTPGNWSWVRLLLTHLACWRYRRADLPSRALLAWAVLVDSLHALEWSGQDVGAASTVWLGFVLMPKRGWRLLLTMLALGWGLQSLFDYWGTWAWARPLPHRCPWLLPQLPWAISGLVLTLLAGALAAIGRTRLLPLLSLTLLPWPGPTRSALQTRATLGGRSVDLPELPQIVSDQSCQWLLLSNNPERSFSREPERLLQQATPPGRGRVLISHIQLGWFPRDLVVRAHCAKAARLRVAHQQSRDGGWVDAGSQIPTGKLNLVAQAEELLSAGSAREWRVRSVYGNAILCLEVQSDQELRWTVDWTRPQAEPGNLPTVAMREGQSRGLFGPPDQEVELQGETGAWHWKGPWLRNQRGESLLGNYGCRRTLRWTAAQPGEAWLVARGGVLGGPPFLAAGQSRRLLAYGAGPQVLELWLPVNSFAPFSVVLLPRSDGR